MLSCYYYYSSNISQRYGCYFQYIFPSMQYLSIICFFIDKQQWNEEYGICIIQSQCNMSKGNMRYIYEWMVLIIYGNGIYLYTESYHRNRNSDRKCSIQIMNDGCDYGEQLNYLHNSHFIHQSNKYDIHQYIGSSKYDGC